MYTDRSVGLYECVRARARARVCVCVCVCALISVVQHRKIS